MSVAGVHSENSAATSALVGDDIRSCERAEACGCPAVEVFITIGTRVRRGLLAALGRKAGPNRPRALQAVTPAKPRRVAQTRNP